MLDALITALRSATIEIVDLTARLNSGTPVLQLPEPFGNTCLLYTSRASAIPTPRTPR